MSDEKNPLELYFALMTMNGAMHVYHAAQDLGIFSALQSGSRTLPELAKATELQEKFLQLLLNTLSALQIVKRKENQYFLSPVMQLLAGNYQDLGDKYWNHLPELLKTGEPLVQMNQVEESEQHYQLQVLALDWMMRPAAEAAAKLLKLDASTSELNILDVGAGSAIWSLTFAKKNSAARVTAIDWPGVLKIASRAAQTAKLDMRFTALPGNYHEVEIPDAAFDLIILANVSHLESPEGNIALLKKFFKALRQFGRLLVIDVMACQPEGQLAAALYALGLALRTKDTQVYSEAQLSDWLRLAGFRQIELLPIETIPFTMGMLVATK